MQHHIVQYQVFDVAFANAGKSYELQNKISDIFNNQLMDGMEQLFSRLVPNDTLLTLGDVNIDIGKIPYNLIEYDLVDRILDELEREINHRLALIPSKNEDENSGQQLKKIESGYTNLLEYFLLTGAMPWWATGELLNDPVTIMEHLIAKDAAILKQLIIKVGQHNYVRQRLIYQFSEQVIRSIITIIEPGQAAFIFDYHTSVVHTHHQEKLIEGVTNTEFDKALWLFILTCILVDRGSIFNQKIFVKSTLGQMAHHYNLSYAQILALLSKALVSHNLTDVQNSNLTLIISELSIDEFDDRRGGAVLNITNTGAEEVVQQNIELIRYYLVFGSLPWWSEPYSESSLVNILLDLIKVVPKTFSKLIKVVGQNEEVRKRITTVFDDEIITAIVRLLEPAGATFIINYAAEIQVIHTKKPAVYTDGKDFKKAVWKFIFDFLLIERGSVFNEQMFLENNIRKLANNYNVQYADMLLYLVQSVGQVHQASIEHAPLFQLLASLLNDVNQQIIYLEPSNNTGLNAHTQTSRTVVLKDVLLHWLAYGSIPWWGSKYFEQGPAAMFQTLFTTGPAEAFLLLKYAGTIPHIRKRVIYQIPEQLIINLLGKQPGGEGAVKLYQYLLQAFNKVNGSHDLSGSFNVLLLIFWDVYIAGEYKKFDNVSFIKKGIYGLIKQQDISQKEVDQNDINYHAIIEALKSIFSTANETTYLKSLDTIALNTDTDVDLILEESFNTDVDVRQSLIHYLSVKAPSQQAIIDEVLLILKYFLNNNNKLPQQFKGTNPTYVKAVIEQLLQVLKKSDIKAYKQLILSNKELKGYVQDNADATIVIDGSIEQLISDYLLHDYQPNKEDILNEALDILEHFLTTGKLPEPFAGANIPQILKQLLLLLNYGRSAALNNILQHDGYLTDARMLLHNLFATTANTAESNVSRTLKEYLERDIIKYIEQQPGFVNSDETIAGILDRYIKQSQGQHNLIMPLLKNQAIARYIARGYNDEQVSSLLNNNLTLIGGSENVIWINDLQLLIANNITDTLQRERLVTLLREFNLLILGKHIAINSFVAYLKQLLKFISSANYSLFTALSNVMFKAGSTPGLSPAFTTKLSLVLTEMHIYNATYKTEQRVKQQLIKADDSAIQSAIGINADKKGIEAKQLKEEIKQNIQITEDIMKDENKQLLVNSKDTIYINNAGLVLLHPLLATYFVRLGMMIGGKFINADAQLRAVHLLQYLVNGKSNNPEHFLVLNKVLCNVPVEEPVPAEISLTDEEKETSAQLLIVVTSHWDKLKNTSIEGLQESFLQRDGALVFKDDAWHLKVEQRGYDVLLQSYPWTIGMIKTPWMDNFLYVEWT
ncbi:contractile injection system tape measure protein [Mucilaginibacter sp.]